ncbi:hypothetical protein POM88_044815 [Heracleum sosnowskyi]|uniref:DUF7769 domain-containing protein n=1 Tax=Heracleum sosnowskyi TaxID=360622 RepID=A0AAD8H5Z5_9APIA|nr:hypothetical protein POM88_044815 [Heracleum sosnowskyi]
MSRVHLDLNVPLDESGNPIDLNFIPNSQDSTGEDSDLRTEGQINRVKVLTNTQRQTIYMSLLEKSLNGKLKKGTTKAVALLFSVSMTTVQRIWRRAKESSNIEGVDVSHRRTKNCGRKRVQFNSEQFKNIPLSRRTSLRSIACAMNVSQTTLSRWKKRGDIKRHTNPLKPLLKDENKISRLKFCMSMLDKETLPHDPRFIDIAIQSLQHKESPRTVDELVSAVEKAYEEFSPVKSNRVFLSLQLCMRESMKDNGSNNYKIPHINKAGLERQGRLPCQIKCDQKLVEDVLAQLV